MRNKNYHERNSRIWQQIICQENVWWIFYEFTKPTRIDGKIVTNYKESINVNSAEWRNKWNINCPLTVRQRWQKIHCSRVKKVNCLKLVKWCHG